MQLLVGSLLERPPGPNYVAALRFAEIAPTGPLPKVATLRRWRDNLPPGFEIALRVPDSCWRSPEGPLRPSPELDRGLGWLAEASDALQACLVVVATGAAVTTGARDRERLREYFGRIPQPEDRRVVWRSTGLWDPEPLQNMANSMGVIGGFDALDDPAPSADILYASLRAEGLRRSFSHAQLLEVIDKIAHSDASHAFVTIESEHSFREAKLLQSLSKGQA